MLEFKPHYVVKPWGNRRFESRFGRELPSGTIGESWELSGGCDQISEVASGPKTGRLLNELWAEGALGGSASGDFPFLLKWIDTNERMSAQVHPDLDFCRATQCGAPKTEAWVIAELESKSKLLIGNYPGLDSEILVQALQRGSLEKWMYESMPRVGDMFLIEAGTLHAIGAGFLILEVQEPSDVTFRVCDWERVDENGQSRELHVEQAIHAIHYNRFDMPRAQRAEVEGPSFHLRAVPMGATLSAEEQLRVFVGHSPQTSLLVTKNQQYSLKYGDVLVAEPSDGPISVASGKCILITEPLE